MDFIARKLREFVNPNRTITQSTEFDPLAQKLAENHKRNRDKIQAERETHLAKYLQDKALCKTEIIAFCRNALKDIAERDTKELDNDDTKYLYPTSTYIQYKQLQDLTHCATVDHPLYRSKVSEIMKEMVKDNTRIAGTRLVIVNKENFIADSVKYIELLWNNDNLKLKNEQIDT